MIIIRQETDGTFSLEGLDEADLMTLFIMSETCRRRVVATVPLSEEAGNLSGLIQDYYKNQKGHAVISLP
jgi:hypothetical protein